MSTPPTVTQSTAKSASSASASENSGVVTAPTPVTTVTTPVTAVSPGKFPAPPSSLPVSPISPASKQSSNGGATTRSDSISFGSILAPDPPAAEKASLAVSMTSVAEHTSKSDADKEEAAHEIHCDHLSVHSQTSGTLSYLTMEVLADPVTHYTKKKKPKQIYAGRIAHYGNALIAKQVVPHTQSVQPLRCKANPKLLKLLNARQKDMRKANARGRRFFQITAVRLQSRDPTRRVGDRDMGVGYLEAHVAALTEFIASPLSAHSRLLIRTKIDEFSGTVVNVDIDVIDERNGCREAEDDVEARVPDAQVNADYYSTLDRPAVNSTESLTNVRTDCEAVTAIKAHDVSTAKPISARPAGGLFSRIVKRLTFGIFG
ncbi:hypothetical protein PENTCL1PPCAC_23489 [Pristionchus entomophagus]|uniref:Uncharacterized protein n=1 Tax=Pristionchus entomophagus TaxID=358040 RepID=A0AAV5U4J5_9BILA|nr:hypothetical protein PENTCL1PPCAC_23489 [Pristionchus entomophagus]